MAPDKLAPSDPRASHHKVTVNGRTYHYILSKPDAKHVGTILLIHGFPDIHLSWRYQVPFLVSLGFQVIVPDMLGYGQTDAPDDVEPYSLKSLSGDMAELAGKVVPGEQIILGGHDWGGAFVWRMVLWYPDLIRGVFSVCTPYMPPSPVYYDLEKLVQMRPTFKYQIQLAGPDPVRELNSEERIRQFLNGIYGGRGPNGELAFNAENGILFDNLPLIGPNPFFSKDEIDFYVQEFARHGMRGPTNWYRTREVNYKEELELLKDGAPKVKVPCLMIAASKDTALPPSMMEGMEKNFDSSLEKHIVDASHWALWQAADEVNTHLKGYLTGLVGASPKASI